MRKVLHVVESLALGGAERVVVEYAARHDRARYCPEVCCVVCGGPLEEVLAAEGVPVHVLERRGRLDLRPIVSLTRLIARGRYDVVHTHNFTALSAGVPAAILGGAKAVVRTEHNVDATPVLWRRHASRLAALRENAQIAVAVAVRDSHVRSGRIPATRLAVVRNGIDLGPLPGEEERAAVRRELGVPADTCLCLTIGSLIPQKGHRVLLEAARIAGSERPNVSFAIVGTGPGRCRLESRADELGVTERVAFLGPRLDVPRLLRAADVFVLSSAWEGLPVTILEAMAAGLPCVTTGVGGIEEAVRDGVEGFVVGPNDPSALAERILTLARDPDLRSRLGEAGRATYEARFRGRQMVRQTEALYDLALTGRANFATRDRVKVLFVIGQLTYGGAERQLLELVSRLPRDRFEPVVCSLTDRVPLAPAFEAAGVRVVRIGKGRGMLSGASLELLRLIRAEGPSIVHAFLVAANWRALLVGRLARVPIVVTSVRNVDIHTKAIGTIGERLLSGLTDRVIANAQAVKDYVADRHWVAEDRIRVIYNGISLERVLGGRAPAEASAHDAAEAAARAGVEAAVRAETASAVSDAAAADATSPVGGASATEASGSGVRSAVAVGEPARSGTVVNIASLSPKKDHATFLSAARLVLERLPGTHFVIVGGGPLRSELEALAASLGIAEAVRFAGESDDIGAALTCADVSVLTSIKEGCSNVVLESMAAGLPVVATDVGGNAELLEEGVSGFLLPAGDADGIARRIVELLEDEGLARRMGRAGSERVRSRFTVQRMVDDTVAFYEETLAERLPGLIDWVDAAAAREPEEA